MTSDHMVRNLIDVNNGEERVRVLDQFRKLLENYRDERLEDQHRELFNVLT